MRFRKLRVKGHIFKGYNGWTTTVLKFLRKWRTKPGRIFRTLFVPGIVSLVLIINFPITFSKVLKLELSITYACVGLASWKMIGCSGKARCFSVVKILQWLPIQMRAFHSKENGLFCTHPLSIAPLFWWKEIGKQEALIWMKNSHLNKTLQYCFYKRSR